MNITKVVKEALPDTWWAIYSSGVVLGLFNTPHAAEWQIEACKMYCASKGTYCACTDATVVEVLVNP